MQKREWQAVRMVVFDLDGTLYDQRRLRSRMAFRLLRHCLTRPQDARILRWISTFRRCREELADAEAAGIRDQQYRRPASTLGIDHRALEEVVRIWMHERPLDYLRECRFPEVERLFDVLRERGTKIAVLSDFPVATKLERLELRVDIVVTAEDPEVDRLKPHAAGLQYLLKRTGIPPQRCLLIGDRDDRDGECARRLEVPFLLKSSESCLAEGRFADFAELLAQDDGREPA